MKPSSSFIFLASASIALIFAIVASSPVRLCLRLFNWKTTADLVVRNAIVYTSNDSLPFVDSIAVHHGRILRLGNYSSLKELVGYGTKELDLKGKIVVPGFIDSHLHFIWGGRQLTEVDLRGINKKDDFVRRVKEAARNAKPGSWIFGGGWNNDLWGGDLPTASWIDHITLDNPVWLSRMDRHMGLANTAALKVARIINASEDPHGGIIMRTASGGNGRGIRKEETFKEAAMNRGKVVNAEGHQRRSLARRNHGKDFCNTTYAKEKKESEVVKSWKLAVVVNKKSVGWTWEAIKNELERKLSRSTELVPLAANRSARNSWIGIEGLPLNLWNYHVFKIIGDNCSGLVEIAEDTLGQSFLLFAKIKVRGFKDGFMSPIMEVSCQGERIHLGLFNLENNQPYSTLSNGRTSGLIWRSIEMTGDAIVGKADCINKDFGIIFLKRGNTSYTGNTSDEEAATDGDKSEIPIVKATGFNGVSKERGSEGEKSVGKIVMSSFMSWVTRGKRLRGNVSCAQGNLPHEEGRLGSIVEEHPSI
ncbi:Putative amidohydrolase ytcJ [Morus notabilis]|uniref:Putative amidohydrolase ytcJ n=1 Tax=Morus notabilis TaxID=981085 RepID=W9RAT5_9ROSA|nr:Putative amidohydrolase ytcJ [Morus notabilis]